MESVPEPGAPAPDRSSRGEERDQLLDRLPRFRAEEVDPVREGRAFLAEGRRVVEEAHRAGASGRAVVRATSELVDGLLQGLFSRLTAAVTGLPAASLVALGGYGRRELAPRSDLDLALVYDGHDEPPPALASLAERLLYALWDLKLEVGWSVRTAAQCAELAERDHTARTALVDCRPVAGSSQAWALLERAVLVDLLARCADQFIADKVEEMKRRRARFGESVYLLEPHVKQGGGGLRDLQAALWIARARFRAAGISDLLHRSILPPGEVAELLAARDFVWRVRNDMHYATGRREDRLTFDLQLLVAGRLGYRDGAEELAVEQLMHDWYLAAAAIRRSADALVARCEEAKRRTLPRERRIDHEFKAWGDKITLATGDLFARSPAAVVRLFAVADREGLPLYSFARDRVHQEKGRIDEAVRASDEVTASLRQMFVRPGTRGEFLTAMHELGVLGAVFPEFGRITAKHRHDLYHAHTVDVHSIATARRLYALRNGELAEAEPELTRLMQSLDRPLPLYLAALFHDAGKGGGPGHAERGADLMRSVALRLALTPRDGADAEMLVARHMDMSHLSQRRDLSDRALVAGFARDLGDSERLLMLYLLTWADLCSVAPHTWTEWKGRLLRELYERALEALAGTGGDGAEERRERMERELAARFGDEEARAFLAVMPERYVRTASAEDAVRHLRLMRSGRRRPLAALLVHGTDHTELVLTAPDRAGLLAIFAGALAAHRVDILRAEIFSTSDGRALDRFAVRGHRGPLERERWRAVRADLVSALEGELDVRELVARRAAPASLERFVPRVATHIAIDNRSGTDATIVDVYAQDRVGLLATIAFALYDQGVAIDLAKIATEGNRATDGFYVRKDKRKIEAPETLRAIEHALREALDRG